MVSLLEMMETGKGLAVKIEPKTPWEICKQAVRNMSPDVEGVAKGILTYHPYRGRKHKLGAFSYLEIDLQRIQGYEVTLTVAYEGNVIRRAFYTAWNDTENVCCKFDPFNGKEAI